MTAPRLLVALLLVSVPGCISITGSDSSNPEEDDVVGTYSASVFLLPGLADGSVDILAAGGSFTLTLGRKGLAEGRLHIPVATAVSSEPTDQSFSGTYEVGTEAVVLDVEPAFPLIGERFEREPEGRLVASFSGRGAYEVVLERE